MVRIMQGVPVMNFFILKMPIDTAAPSTVSNDREIMVTHV